MSAIGGYRSIVIRWTNPNNTDLARIEIWAGLANDRALAGLIAAPNSGQRGTAQQWTHQGRTPGEIVYYWIRAVDYSGNAGGFTPSSPTGGWSATATMVPIADVVFPWTEVTGTTEDMVANAGYIANNAVLVSLRLPITSALGAVIYIAGKGAGGWRVTQRASQQIHLSTQSTTVGTGGVLAAPNPFSAITLHCIAANTIWEVTGGVA